MLRFGVGLRLEKIRGSLERYGERREKETGEVKRKFPPEAVFVPRKVWIFGRVSLCCFSLVRMGSEQGMRQVRWTRSL